MSYIREPLKATSRLLGSVTRSLVLENAHLDCNPLQCQSACDLWCRHLCLVQITLDRCFREEKKLRVKLNRRQGDAASPVMLLDSPPRLPSNGPAAAPSSEPPAK